MFPSDFDYELPDDRIAQYPAPRGESRLLAVERDRCRDLRIGDLPGRLEPGDLLVVNDTKVIPARLLGRRVGTGGAVELLLVRKLDDRQWLALARPGRRARKGSRISLAPGLEAELREALPGGQHRVRFSQPPEPLLETIGHVPLPPYIKRPDEPADRDRYQTVFARRPGAVAAPTAGLHFTPAILERIRERGIEVARITLHVGIGTFKPVRSELVREHRMERERITIPVRAAEAVRRARKRRGRVVAVGTTVVRALEGAAAAGDGELRSMRGSTDLFIYPGFDFRVVDLLLTNFHLPRSTLLMLVCAFGGTRRILDAYAQAIRLGYSFYSYGDAMLVDRAIRAGEREPVSSSGR